MFHLTQEQRKAASAKAGRTRTGRVHNGHYKYASRSSRPNAPYGRVMQASDERTALALSRLDALPDSAIRPPRNIRAIIEHRADGAVREYPVSPIGRPVMDIGGPEILTAPNVGDGPRRKTA